MLNFGWAGVLLNANHMCIKSAQVVYDSHQSLTYHGLHHGWNHS